MRQYAQKHLRARQTDATPRSAQERNLPQAPAQQSQSSTSTRQTLTNTIGCNNACSHYKTGVIIVNQI
jgi:hypothetical protein